MTPRPNLRRLIFSLLAGLLFPVRLRAADPPIPDHLAPGAVLSLRLTAPVSTWTAKPGDPVFAVLTENLSLDKHVILAMGTPVEGVVLKRRKVGWGIRHETAALELEFTRASTPAGAPLRFASRVEEVENARESVRKGTIEGIRSTNTFQGTVNSRLIHLPTWNPYTDPVLAIYKIVFPIFPEPEIFYPAGTDLRVRTTSTVALPHDDGATAAVPPPSSTPDLDQLHHVVAQLPERVTTGKHVDADVINFAFVGSREIVSAAFHTAGWDTADPVSRRTVMKNLYALLNNDGYPRQPMSTFYLQGRPQDMSWQRSLNSYGRRDHLRAWRWRAAGIDQPVWLGSSTHDTGATLSVRYRGFMHTIAPDLDQERSVVVRDLDFAGCVQSVTYISRPGLSSALRNATGDTMHTDGKLAVVVLQACQPRLPPLDRPQVVRFRPGNHAFRFFRRQILTVRSDLWRANILYGAYDGTRRVVEAFRH